MKKEELREIYKQKRIDLTEHEVASFQENIYQQIYNLDTSSVKNVHLFLSMRKFNEIDTQPIINFFRKKHIKIVVSRCNFKDDTLSHFYLEEDTVLELNKFGVPEPINAVEVDEKELDLIFVPLLISDELNYRVGYGKGYYDRFLSKCTDQAQFIGVNFFKPIYQIEDSNEFDIPLHQVIYPK
ncbi:5-formyltetrahydrofolate cyclo-ligase [Polaribacter butkevichii]|uniref:5-formyltetrahydrofolate cyclo-ligase n=1 Tax=Polaribacter butkevichii TaxID=218490 RepID=A0A2P6C6D2_9FLAO|nr:5-formyltetrahydrofolate cyclo-ligase [Polaribacter butkevichii]PQJ68472.1 5-formyltetrahydrofolate cyclo-ligase [Polaribacter butkevichii]